MLLLLACTATPTFTEAQRSAGVEAAGNVEGDRLMFHVANLVTTRSEEEPYFPPEARYEGMPFTHLNSADYVAAALEGANLTPSIETGGLEGRETHTVLADIPGGSNADEIVLVSAHHDAWFFGADDNATGVAVILEVARVLAYSEPDRTIRIVSFDREEEGLVGAAEYASAHDGFYRIVNLDSVGYTDSAPGSQTSILGLDAPDTGDFLAVIAPEMAQDDLLASLALAAELPSPMKTAGVLSNGNAHSALTTDLLRSDHAPFWAMGVPGLFFTDTTQFRNPKYHTEEDTIDTLDPVFLAQVGAFTAAVVAAYAEAE
ncbi:MAG: M28 family peptidase [Myxococcota bacterium]